MLSNFKMQVDLSTFIKSSLMKMILTISLFSIATNIYAEKFLLVVGDSLSSGYGIEQGKSWVELLENRIKPMGYSIINVSTSGDTTRNGKAKLEKALKIYKPKNVIIALGANDGLRGLSLTEIEHNLSDMIEQCIQNKATLLLVATRLPPNYGNLYIKKFRAIYKKLSQRYQIVFVPLFLKDVAGDVRLTQEDGLHPNEEAQKIIVENIWSKLGTSLNASKKAD
jgi:acyl-CoA thioesterase-1